MWSALNNFRDGALLFFRGALGGFYLWLHGWGRLAGGFATWKKLGAPMKHLGISFLPEAWGFMAALASTVAVVLFIIGFAYRPACMMILITLLVAILAGMGSGIGSAATNIELAIVAFTCMFVGPGRYSLDKV